MSDIIVARIDSEGSDTRNVYRDAGGAQRDFLERTIREGKVRKPGTYIVCDSGSDLLCGRLFEVEAVAHEEELWVAS